MGIHDRDTDTHPFFATPTLDTELAELPDGWDAAIQFHRLKRVLPRRLRKVVEERAIVAILDRARELLRHASRPTHSVADAFPGEGELDLETTLENPRPWRPEDLVVRRNQLREADVVAILDMSLSMTGEKVALTALATAILRLKLDALAVVSFDTVAHRLVRVGEAPEARVVVGRILEVPAQGYTNIEEGLRTALAELDLSRRRERAGVILTDGVANVGWDPVRVAQRFPRLHVVQVGPEEPRGTETCQRMARAGRGRLYRAQTYEQLPEVVRRLVRECFET